MPTEEELSAAIRGCPPGGTSELLANYYELIEARIDGVSALLFACYLGRMDVGRAIARQRIRLDVFEAAALGETGALAALIDHDGSLVDAVGPDGARPLGVATFFGQDEAVRLLLARGADPGGASRDALRATPLHIAAARHRPAIAALLIEHRAPIEARQQGGFTPLMIAALQRQREIADLLLARGADPEARDDFGRSAFDYAHDAGFDLVAPRLVT